jgi:hypothetical protein
MNKITIFLDRNKTLHKKFFFTIAFIFPALLPKAQAQVTYDNNSMCSASTVSSSSSLSIPGFTVPAGDNKVLVVLDRSSVNATVSSLTFNGSNFIRLDNPVSNNGARAEVWYLVLGHVSSSITGTITASYSASNVYMALTAASFSGVNQATPLNNLSSNTFEIGETSSGLSISGASGDMAFEAISAIGNGTQPPSFIPTSSQTSISACTSTPISAFGQSAAYKLQTGASQTLSWSITSTSTSSEDGIQIAANIQRSSSALPIDIASFTAVQNNQGNLLNWTEDHSQDVQYFEVQRGNDGRNFYSVGKVTVTDPLASDFFFQDQGIRTGTDYYRLVIHFLSGNTDFSNTLMVNNESQTSLVSIYPNPVTDKINIKTSNPDQPVRLYDMKGKLQYNATHVPDQVDVSHFPSGVYFLRIGDCGFKVIKE